MNLRERFMATIKEAQDLLNADKLDEAKAKREEAETLKAKIQEFDDLMALQQHATGMSSSTLPLPGTTGVPPVVQNQDPVQPQHIKDGVDQMNQIQAAYVQRFGTTEKSIEAILVDLHGSEYMDRFWQQRRMHNVYLRRGDNNMTHEQKKLLREVVLTPNAVKNALLEGVDDVSYLRATMIEAADTLGGALVPIDTQNRIIERIRGMTIMRGRADVQTTSRDRVEWPKWTNVGDDTTDRYTSPLRQRWVDETPSSLEAQNVTFGSTSFSVHTAMVEVFISRNLLEDTAFNIEGYLERKFAEAVAIDDDDQFWFGNGVGKPRGILPGQANPTTDAGLQLREVTSGTASSPYLTWDKLLAIPYSIPVQYRRNGAWFMNKNTVLALRQLKNASTGDYYWQPFQYEGGQGDEPQRFLGYQILEQEGFADLAVGAYPIAFGDVGSYMIVDRVGMSVERYLDGSTVSNNMVKFVMRRRVGGQMLEPWRMTAMKVAA